MRNSLIILSFVALLAGSCTNSPEKEQTTEMVNEHVQELHEQVMAYHDEVMPYMGEIMSLKTSLRAAADTLTESKSGEALLIAGELESADSAMMGWMRQFDIQLSNPDTSAAISYYEDQLVKVQTMRDKVAGALENGRRMKANLSGF